MNNSKDIAYKALLGIITILVVIIFAYLLAIRSTIGIMVIIGMAILLLIGFKFSKY